MANSKKVELAEASNALLEAINAPVAVNPTCRISKSKYMAGMQCLRREYPQVHHHEIAVAVDVCRVLPPTEVGIVARGAFPGGVLVAGDSESLSDCIRHTRELVANPEIPALLEGTFVHNGC